jgi:hypothetical protein
MANLNDLDIKCFSDMTDDERFVHIMTVRSLRRTKVAKETKKKAPAKTKSTGDILSMLSPQQAEALLKQLEG